MCTQRDVIMCWISRDWEWYCMKRTRWIEEIYTRCWGFYRGFQGHFRDSSWCSEDYSRFTVWRVHLRCTPTGTQFTEVRAVIRTYCELGNHLDYCHNSCPICSIEHCAVRYMVCVYVCVRGGGRETCACCDDVKSLFFRFNNIILNNMNHNLPHLTHSANSFLQNKHIRLICFQK